MIIALRYRCASLTIFCEEMVSAFFILIFVLPVTRYLLIFEKHVFSSNFSSGINW